jgi:hypothetical protein
VILAYGGISATLSAQNFGNPFVSAPSVIDNAPRASDAENRSQLPGDDVAFTTGLPFRPQPSNHSYNLKMGAVDMNFGSSVTLTWLDNILSVPSTGAFRREGDFELEPRIGVNLDWPINSTTDLRFDLGLGYRVALSHSQFDAIMISPDSIWHYEFYVEGVRVSVFDQMATVSQGSFQSQIVGNGSAGVVDFQRFQNTGGLSAAIPLDRYTSLSLGYSAATDIELGEQFASYDRITHAFTAALYRQIEPHLTVGLSANTSINSYFNTAANDSFGYGGGPLVQWAPSKFLSLSGGVHYNVFTFSNGATNAFAGSTEFRGFGYDFSLTHRLNKRMDHVLSFSKGLNYGLGNNYTEYTVYTYAYHWAMRSDLSFGFNASYGVTSPSGAGLVFIEPPVGSVFGPAGGPPQYVTFPGGNRLFLSPGWNNFGPGIIAIPIPGEEPSTLNLQASFNYTWTRHLSATMGYGHQRRFSNYPGREYYNNSVGVTLNYRF